MGKKLQIKLLSNSGELLNVVNCFAGQVAVLRANSQADLRPYQRALAGAQGKEKFSVTVDGSEFHPDEHTLIGLGEPAPHAGLTAREYLVSLGVPDASVEALLSSYGLESTADKRCSSLSADEERRVRILAATCTPKKVVVINEPFEPLLSQWKERFAEILTSFARTRSGIVVVTGLSYRPECWIDNEIVARVQVGETIQRTIGFGSGGSQSNVLMNQLRDMLKDDGKVQELLAKHGSAPGAGPSHSSKASATAALGAAAVGASGFEDEDPFLDDEDGFDENELDSRVSSSSLVSRVKALLQTPFAGVALTVGAGVIGVSVALVGINAVRSGSEAPAPVSVAHSNPIPEAKPEKVVSDSKPPEAVQPTAVDPVEQAPQNPVRVVAEVPQQQPPSARYILDEYPENIRVSLLDTTRGIVGEMPISSEGSTPPSEQNAPKGNGSGNLFKLLESASTKQGDPVAAQEPYSAPPPEPESEPNSYNQPESDVEPSDEQARREAIRQKFLEAIRAAAERRQATMDGGQ